MYPAATCPGCALTGVCLHGSRSGVLWTVEQEFNSTRGYAKAGAAGLYWDVTIGELKYSRHRHKGASPVWGYHAREHSRYLAGIEIAQARLGDFISDDLIYTTAVAIHEEILSVHAHLSAPVIKEHWELPAGVRDGKTDVWYGRPDELSTLVREMIVSFG